MENWNVRFYDGNLHLLSVPSKSPIIQSARQRANQADAASFSVSADEASDLTPAAHVAIYKGDDQKAAGYIDSRDFSDERASFSIEGFAAYLRRQKTPSMWTNWNGLDLAQVVKDHINDFKFMRINTKAGWDTTHNRIDVDTDTEPGSVLLAQEPHPDDAENTRPKLEGYVYVRKDLGPNALTAGRILRWSEEVGSDVRISFRTRAASSEALLSGTAWGPAMTAVHADDIQENETKGLPISGHGRYIEIEIKLQTDNQNEPARDGEGHIIGYGFTPQLKGLEIIWREPGKIKSGLMPASTGVIVDGYEFSRTNMLRSLANICDDHGWQFKVRFDPDTQSLYLDLGQEVAGIWESRFGVDRSKTGEFPVLLKQNKNTRITTIRDNIQTMANVLDCFGAGDGTSKLHIQLTDEASILDHGRIPDDFEDSTIDTIEALTEAGQAELAKRSQPDTAFRCEVYEDHNLHAGDLVTVISPKSGAIVDARIEEINYQHTENKEVVQLGLNEFLYGSFEQFAPKPADYYTGAKIPDKPSQISATGYPGQNIITWIGPTKSYVLRWRKTESVLWQSRQVDSKEFIHAKAEKAVRYEYQVAAIQNKRISEWTNSVYATADGFQPDPIPAPEKPTWALANPIIEQTIISAQNQRMARITVTWTLQDDAASYRLERSENADVWQPVAYTGPETSQYADTNGLTANKLYYYRLFAFNETGEASVPSDVVSITTGANPIPVIPTTAPTTIAGFKLISITVPGVTSAFDKQTIAYYEFQFQEANATQIFDGSTPTGDYTIPASPAWGAWTAAPGEISNSRLFTHFDLSYAKVYRHRYRSVNTSLEPSGWSHASAGRIPLKHGAQDMAYRSITAQNLAAGAVTADAVQVGSLKYDRMNVKFAQISNVFTNGSYASGGYANPTIVSNAQDQDAYNIIDIQVWRPYQFRARMIHNPLNSLTGLADIDVMLGGVSIHQGMPFSKIFHEGGTSGFLSGIPAFEFEIARMASNLIELRVVRLSGTLNFTMRLRIKRHSID